MEWLYLVLNIVDLGTVANFDVVFKIPLIFIIKKA